MVPRVNAAESTMTSLLRDFLRINPPIFVVSKVGEDPRVFLDGVYKMLSAIGVTSRKKWSKIRTNRGMFFKYGTLNQRIIG